VVPTLVAGVNEGRAEKLLSGMGFESFRPGQQEAVEAALAGRDSLVVMPTGGGKSLCYQLPGLASEDLTIVVSPLIALMNEQTQRLSAAGHPVTMVTSTMGHDARNRALTMLGGEARIVYCSPERFGSSLFLELLSRRRIDLLAVDEAHCISAWGHDFRPDYLRLPEIAEQLGRPPVMACTATATEAVTTEILSRFALRDPLLVRSSFDRPNLSFDVLRLEGRGSQARRMALLEAGLRDAANRPAIVYCGTRRGTDEVAAALCDTGIPAVRYHAGMESVERDLAQESFMSGETDVVVATNAFGMGIDKRDVRSVWHLAIPTSLEAYYQEAGRAGRDGGPARAVLLALRTDLGRLVRFNRQRGGIPELATARQRGWRDYRIIKDFVYAERCRRRSLLDHFGDGGGGSALDRCCDVCDPPAWLPDPGSVVTRPPRRAGRPSPAAGLPPVDVPLFERLKGWRLRAADGKPAFTVAHNSTLEAIAARRPSDEADLMAIRGVGPSFVSKHAADVLAIVAEHTGPAERRGRPAAGAP
jgi:RecQ family ATP-dependent DNA helicase